MLEFLGSSVDVSLAGPAVPDGTIARLHGAVRRGSDAVRAAGRARGGRRARRPRGRSSPRPAGDEAAFAATVAQPTKVDNDLYVRDYSKCILCYKCVEACGEDAQNTFAIAVAGRGFDARISTEQAVPLPESACVYCGNCIGVCPTGALMAKTEYDMREAGTWDGSAQTVTSTICPYCGVGCVVDLHVQDERILKVTSPLDSSVTDGHLCIKGRFGFEFVNERPKREDGGGPAGESSVIDPRRDRIGSECGHAGVGRRGGESTIFVLGLFAGGHDDDRPVRASPLDGPRLSAPI